MESLVWGGTVFPALMRLRQVYLQVKANLRHRTEIASNFGVKGRREGEKEGRRKQNPSREGTHKH